MSIVRNLAALLLGVVLITCTAGGTITPQSVVDWIKENCGAITTAIDIAALITANPAVNSAAALGEQVCSAIKLQRAEQLKETRGAAPATSGTVIVNGVPIHYEVK